MFHVHFSYLCSLLEWSCWFASKASSHDSKFFFGLILVFTMDKIDNSNQASCRHWIVHNVHSDPLNGRRGCCSLVQYKGPFLQWGLRKALSLFRNQKSFCRRPSLWRWSTALCSHIYSWYSWCCLLGQGRQGYHIGDRNTFPDEMLCQIVFESWGYRFESLIHRSIVLLSLVGSRDRAALLEHFF